MKIFDTYQEAEKHLLEVPWRVTPCTQEDCWCAGVGPVESIRSEGEIEEEHYVVGTGVITKELAEYIVNLHNEKLSYAYQHN